MDENYENENFVVESSVLNKRFDKEVEKIEKRKELEEFAAKGIKEEFDNLISDLSVEQLALLKIMLASYDVRKGEKVIDAYKFITNMTKFFTTHYRLDLLNHASAVVKKELQERAMREFEKAIGELINEAMKKELK